MSRNAEFNAALKCLSLLALLVVSSIGVTSNFVNAADEPTTNGTEESSPESTSWDIESPPGPAFDQPIEVNEGTWISVDVSPDGREIVFDLLGDLYVMPIDGADGSNGNTPEKITSGVSWDMQPRFSPDGSWIAFTSDRSGKSKRAGDNLWIIRRDGSELRQISNETFRLVNGPAWSPDGTYLIGRKHFTSRRSLGSGEIWMYHVAGASSEAMGGVQLTSRPNDQKDVNEAVFSPDGRYVYYSQDATPGDTFEYDKDSHKGIYVIKRLDLEQGETETFVSGPGGACRPVPSPDGKRLAFVRRVGAKTGLHVMDLDSGEIRLVYDRLERDMQEAWAIHGVYPNFAWHPDGQSIIAWAKGKIRRIDVEQGSDAVIPFRIEDTRRMTRRVRVPVAVAPDESPARMLRWVVVSPRGDQVAYQTLGRIYVQDLPDGSPQPLTQQNDHFEFYPSYSRDGRYLVYSTWNDRSLGSIRIASTQPGGNQENWRVTSDPGHYTEPTFSPDGQTVVFVKENGGHLRSALWSQETGIYRISARGGDAVRIRARGSSPHFANSNERFYFVQSQGTKDADNLGLYSVQLDGQEERQHFTSTWATDYRISPDGNWVAFIERFNVHVTPFVQTGRTVTVGPQTNSIPLAKVSQDAGDWIHFSGDSQHIHWALGRKLYQQPLRHAFRFLANEADQSTDDPPSPHETEIGPVIQHAKPQSTFALVGGRILTMSDRGVIDNGTIVVKQNRIVAVGPRETTDIPADATVIPTPGLVIMPGLIDTHAHGAHATAGITPQANWLNYARLAFGVTTVHDPSNATHSIFAASEMARAGTIVAPRTFSTGTILYGATGSFKAEIDSLEDAHFHLRRMKAVGAFSVKSYNQPRRDQRQQVLAAAREQEMMVVPEGGSTFMHNMTMIVDGHTGIEHTLPVQTAYDDVMDLWRGTEVGYTPTLSVAYGGISGERYWYEIDDLWEHPRLNHFIPPHILQPQSRRRQKAPLEDYNHMRVAEIAKQVVDQGGLVQAGGHGQLPGICTHWEMWSFVQGGMTPMQALQCGTLNGAKYLGLDSDLGSIATGKLADLIVISRGHDPTRDIRDSEYIELVMANGRLFHAATMAEVGTATSSPPEFFFHRNGHTVGHAWPRVRGCECTRPAFGNGALLISP